MSGTDQSIERGDLVVAIDAEGEELPRRALGGPVQGQNFEVVWVCLEEEWHAALREGREPDGVPWPAEDVHPRLPADASPMSKEDQREPDDTTELDRLRDLARKTNRPRERHSYGSTPRK